MLMAGGFEWSRWTELGTGGTSESGDEKKPIVMALSDGVMSSNSPCPPAVRRDSDCFLPA
jgi:hypothetical protein